MIRQVHPFEMLVSTCIFVVLAVGLFSGGYWVGHRGMDDLHGDARALRNLLEEAHSQGYLVDDADPLRINVECHGDASDWATIRMANEVGTNYDLPVFVHGNCQTHNIATLPTKADNPLRGICDMGDDRVHVMGASDSDGDAIVCPKGPHGEIINDPAEEGE